MKKMLLLLVPLFLIANSKSFGREPDLLSLAALTAGETTQEQITAMFGKPEKIEDNKKTISWYYTTDDNSVVLLWNKKSEQFIKCSFTSKPCEKMTFDPRISRKLRSGSTDLTQTLALLGTPEDMTIKESKQEVHYSYQNNVLRLFFRDRVLVDYTLLGRGPGY